MWTEFEWENKVNINSKAKSLRDFLDQLMACTNMNCLTPEASLKGDCQFLSANLYARSVFGKCSPGCSHLTRDVIMRVIIAQFR
jgi:coatomer subunit beta